MKNKRNAVITFVILLLILAYIVFNNLNKVTALAVNPIGLVIGIILLIIIILGAIKIIRWVRN